jgi:hypothetical protein
MRRVSKVNEKFFTCVIAVGLLLALQSPARPRAYAVAEEEAGTNAVVDADSATTAADSHTGAAVPESIVAASDANGAGTERGSGHAFTAGSPRGNGNGTHEDPYVVPRTDADISVDAVLDEEAWESALVLTLNYEVRPGENIPPPVDTEVLLTYDEYHLYAAFRCYDADPSAICANLSDRDHIGGGDDWVGLVLDTFNDQRRSFDLLVNPLGVQEDFIEAESGGQSWDGIWDSAGRITEWGYAVEISVPFNQLRFQRADTPQVWGFDAVRSYPRSQRHHIGAFPRDRNNNCYLCQAVKIQGFQGVSPGKNIEITPTLTGTRTDSRPDFPEGGFEVDRQDAEVGLTGRWGVTPNMTFTGTINPDFSHVEADAFQLDINQPFALYYSERRPFFLEGADFFDTLKDAVYTRTFRDPIWGLKLSGKEGGNTVGAYVVQDEITNLIFPGSQYSYGTSLDMTSTGTVLRYKRDVASSSAVGAMLTDREGKDYFNRLLGLDCDLRLTPTDQIQLQVLGSSTDYPNHVVEEYSQPEGDFTGTFVAFEYDHRARNVYWWLDYDQVDRDFRADLGFIPRVGFRNLEGGVHFTWFPEERSWWADYLVGGEVNYYEDDEGNLLDRGGTLWTQYDGAFQSTVYMAAYQYREAYNGEEFDLTSFHIQGGLRPIGTLRLYLWTSFGDRIDYANTQPGERFNVNPYVDYHVNRHLRLELDHTYEHLDVEGGRLYTANISQFSGVYQFNVRTFFRAILQYVHYDRDTDLYGFEVAPEYKHLFTQLLFSYKVNPRTVFYLGYTDDHYGDDEIDITQANRTLFAKLSYAWVQ